MRKSDIRNTTLYIAGFAILTFIIIHIIASRAAGKEDEQEEAIAANHEGIIWSDTLSNNSSDIAATKKMDSEINQFMGRWDLKGMSLAITHNDSLVYAKGYGWADKEIGRKMEATSIMRIASASKLVTAVAIMKLIEEGKFSLDSKVFGPDGILNDSSFTNVINDPRAFDVTVDHLLRHKGGFSSVMGDPMFRTKDIMAMEKLTAPPSNEELTKIVIKRKLRFTPGVGRKYSNFGYMLLSLIIEKTTGQSYWNYVNANVLQPAGIYNMRPATNYYADRHPKEVKYYPPDNELVEEFNGSGKMVERVYGGSNVNGLMGAGGWTASAADIARLVAAIDNYPVVDNILTPKSVNLLTEHDDHDKMSRGWSEADAYGKWSRTGTLSSTHTLIERFPTGECWVLITNSGVGKGHSFSRDLSRLVERLRSRYNGSLPARNLW
ncbi:MAG: beta-lactamase family protein [Bacteroides sp.]|nr:beta-lactamase family protein [Bacteroides sp.]